MLTDHDIDLGQAALAAGHVDARALARAFHAAGVRGAALPFETLLLQAGVSRDALRALEAQLRRRRALSYQETIATEHASGLLPPPSVPPLAAAAPEGIEAYARLGLPAGRFAARFTPKSELGRGGVGRVLSAEDALTGRTVAVKMLQANDATPHQLQRFITEAQTTAQLEHPNVVPVYDFSMLEGGAPCFVMKRVRGRSLKDVLVALDDREPAALEEFTRFRLLQIFISICQAVDYAHSKGVIHRDLKPENVMVGDFGEVLVMDWGIAKILGEAHAPLDSVQPSLAGDSPGTLEGSIVGTPGYMAPEQARGEHQLIEPRTDVWALGAMLYEMLAGVFPFESAGSTIAVLVATATKDVPPMRDVAPNRNIPSDLEEICARALARDPLRRFPSVNAMRQAVESFLAGTREAERRAAEADRLLRDGEESLWYMRMLRDELSELQARLAALPALTGREPLAEKRARWESEDRAASVRKELRRAFAWAEGKFMRAVELAPTLDAPRQLLADMHWRQYRDAIEAMHPATAEEHLKAVSRYRPDDPRLRRPRVYLTTDPPGAEVTLYRVIERDRVLVDTAGRLLGQTPLVDVEVPTGRSVLEIKAPDRRTIRLPIQPWQGDSLRFDIAVPADDAVGEDFVFVPGGPYVRGGDDEALLGQRAQIVDVAPFVIQRFPVTCGAYFEFLNTLPIAAARARAPRMGGRLYVEPDAGGRFIPPYVDMDGDEWHPDWPVFSVSFEDATAYVAWRSTRDGVEYRLPTEDEWEKAARGTDGRRFPWGDHFDPTFCRMRYSLPGDLMPKPVGRFETDCSPYGVRDMAGNVREWTEGWLEEGLRSVRGGAFNHYAFTCRAASRFGYSPRRTLSGVGFRLVKVLSAADG